MRSAARSARALRCPRRRHRRRPRGHAPASRSASASTRSSTGGPSSGIDPAATTWSSADSVSRRRPSADAQHVVERARVGSSRPASFDDVARRARTGRRSAGGGTRSAACGCGSSAGPSADRWSRARTRRASGGSSSVFSSAFDARRREHVDLVEDVHLVPARRCRARPCSMRSRMSSTPLFDAASSSSTSNDVPASIARHELAHAARLAVADVRAVEGLGEDARGRGLAGAARSAEQVGVRRPGRRARRCAGPARRAPGRRTSRTAGAGSGGRGTVVAMPARLPAGFRPASRRGARLPLATRPPCQVAAGSCATAAREPSQGREAAALSGSCGVPQIAWPSPASGGRCVDAPGGMRERPNRHAWKACVGQPTVGSNPTPSAQPRRPATVCSVGAL